jgi:hypothetical protein
VKVRVIEWDSDNEAHFAEHGRATREQIEDILSARYCPTRAAFDGTVRGEKRYRFEGETRHGWFLVVIAAKSAAGVWRPVTCWPLRGSRLGAYSAWRRAVGQ